MQNLNSKIKNEIEKIAKINQEIYSLGEGEDSPRGFGFKRTGKVNFRVMPKNF